MLTLVIGSNRPNSNSRKVAAEVDAIYRGLGVSLRTVDLANLPPEIFAPQAYAEKPPSFSPFAQAVLEADGLIVITPEYNGGVPGVLKYYIDMLKFPESFDRRPVCFIGISAGAFGALRPVEQLQQIFGYRNAYIYPGRVFLPEINGMLSAEGRITSQEILDRLKAQAVGFVEFVERLKNVKLVKS